MGFVERQVKKLREQKGLTQYALGKLVGTSQTQINRYETERGHILAEDLPAFAKALNTTICYLVTGTDDDNYAVADDLDLTNDSIIGLRLQARVVKEKRESEDDIIIRNMYRVVIDVLIHNPLFVNHLYQYLRKDFKSMLIKDDVDDSIAENVEVFPEQLIDIPLKDFESLYRLQLQDDMIAIRNSFTPVRERMNEEDRVFKEKRRQEEKRYYQELQDEQESDPDDKLSDEEYYQKNIADLISRALQQEGEKENGND